jgi:hypothetical protein
MVLGLLKNSTNTPMIGRPVLDDTIGGPFGPARRGRNKKYHTRNTAMAKPCKIIIMVDVLLFWWLDDGKNQSFVTNKRMKWRGAMRAPEISVVTSISGLNGSGIGFIFSWRFYENPGLRHFFVAVRFTSTVHPSGGRRLPEKQTFSHRGGRLFIIITP